MPNETTPRITICIPTFNRCNLLKKALLSVAHQTVKPWETVVVDNCSDDDTEKVVREFAGVKYFRNETNLEMMDNWNRCIELATGEFIALLHSDDLISPDWHEQWLAMIQKNNKPEIGAYFSATFTIDMEENAKIIYRVFYRETLLKPAEGFRKLWKRNMCSLPASAAIIYRKAIFNALGKFNKSYSTEADIAFSLKLLSRFSIFYTPKLLFAYRVHPFQSFDTDKKIKTDEKRFATLSQHLVIFREFYAQLPESRYKTPLFYKRVGYMYIAIAIFCFLSFRFEKAAGYYKLTKKAFPDILKNPGDFFRIFLLIAHYAWKLIIGRIEAIRIRTIAKHWII
ncbi:MAG: glycosyltransferase [Candidatus Omnitrophota bacterium]